MGAQLDASGNALERSAGGTEPAIRASPSKQRRSWLWAHREQGARRADIDGFEGISGTVSPSGAK